MMKTTNNSLILDWPQHRLPVAAVSVVHQEGGVTYSTDSLRYKICTSEDITIGTWNIGTLNAMRKLKELIHEMERYHWNIL